MDSTVALIISISALLFSVLSPIVTAIINGHYSIKEKNLTMLSNSAKENNDFYIKHRAKVIEAYLSAAGKVVYFNDKKASSNFGKCATEIYLYIDESEWHYIDSINQGISSFNCQETRANLEALAKIIANKYSVRIPKEVK